MPFALIIIGVVLLISSARNTLTNQQGTGLYQLLASDFTGSDNFIYWAVAILLIGALGYVPKLKPLSVAFMTLVILVLFLKKGTGVFSQFVSAVGSTQSVTPTLSVSSGSSSSSSSSSSTSSLGSLGNLSSLFGSSNSNVTGAPAPGGLSNVNGPGGVLSDLSIEGSTPVSSSPVTSSDSGTLDLTPAFQGFNF
jgi:hypothetical protein